MPNPPPIPPTVPSRLTVNRDLVIRVFFFTTFAFLLYQLFLLARPFLPSILVAIMLTITFFPLYKWVRKKVRSDNLAALILTFLVVLAAVIPLVILVWIIIKEARNLIPAVQNVMEGLASGEVLTLKERLPLSMQSTVDRAAELLRAVNIDAGPFVMENVHEMGQRIAAFGTLLARNSLFMIARLMILIISLFFLFRDGDRFFKWLLNLIPMEASHKADVARSAYETFRAVTIGVFLTAAAQGLVAMAGFLIAGIRLPVLLGLGVGLVSLLGASFIITLPVGLFILMESTSKGLFLLLWGAIAVGWLDNFLKPILIGSRARMPFILVFFSILGGLKMYGLLGLILGPILVASVLTFIRIYKEAYSS